jgi:predicted DNA-binding transcriptional regulator YafY
MMHFMRADRLISLLMLLQTKGLMTAQDLAERLEVSPRTIYRDLDALSAAGVPVYAERGPQGGCMLLESYRTNLTGLKEDEVRALFMFTVPGLLADLGADKASEAAMLKLTAALPAPFQQDVEQLRHRIHLDTAPWFQPEEPVPYLSLIQEAIWQQRRVRLVYRRGDGLWIKRLVSPYGLVAKTSIWYVVLGIQGRHWVYRVSRIMEAEITEGKFERPSSFNLADYWTQWCRRFERSQEKFAVTLQVSPAGVPGLVQVFGDGLYQVLEEAVEENGRLTFNLTFASAEMACQQLMGLGTAVEIIDPLSLRQKILELSRELMTLYT